MTRPKIVLLGMLTKIPVGGVLWLIGQYAEGFRRLGFEPYYVEAHARTPSMFMRDEGDDATAGATAFLDAELRRFALGGKWAFHALHDDGAVYGMSRGQLDRLYREAALIINVHGGTVPLDEHIANDRLVYLGTDPVELEIELYREERQAAEFLDAHCAYFTWGLNHGNPDCRVPWDSRYPFVPNPPPVIMDWWENTAPAGSAFTTIGNWRQPWRNLVFEGETYTWSKHYEFLKVLDLPRRVPHDFELALSSYEPEDQQLLEEHGWRVRPSMEFSTDADQYRDYLIGSAGELTVAKDQNVRLRSGWFSERSATYLAAGRPVVMQDTGFTNVLPTGDGLFGFTDVEGAAAAVEAVCGDYERHSAGAREVARAFFDYDVSLRALLGHVGLLPASGIAPSVRVSPAIDGEMDLVPVSRRPVVLAGPTIDRVLHRPVPSVVCPRTPPAASIVVPVLDNLVCTRLALESVLAAPTDVPYELVIVDNGSKQPTSEYLSVLASRNSQVRVVRNERNAGYARAINQGVSASTGAVVVLLNNDTIVTPWWLDGLVRHLDNPVLGLLTPVTNRCGNGAEVPTSYRTYAQLLVEAEVRRSSPPRMVPLPVAVMFCVAARRSLLADVGPLDERFEVGLFEDDDYARRVRGAGFEIACAEDVFVHHFGEATIGDPTLAGPYGELFHENRRRFEEKWGLVWSPHERRPDESYESLVEAIREATLRVVGDDALVLVISRGDDTLLNLGRATGRHFPALPDGRYAGAYPADDDTAVLALEAERRTGATHLVIPPFSAWWLEHYQGFERHLDRRYTRIDTEAQPAAVYDLRKERA